MVIPSDCTHRSLARDTTWQNTWIWLGLPTMGVGSGCVVWVFFRGTNAPIPPKLVSLPQAKWRCCSLVWTRHSYTWMMSLGNQDMRCFSTALQTYTTNRLSWYFGNSSCWGAHPVASNLAAVMQGSALYPEFTRFQNLFRSWISLIDHMLAAGVKLTVYLVFYYLVLLPDGLQEGLLAKKQDHLLASWVFLFSFLCVVMAFSEELSLCTFFTVPIIHWVFQLLVSAILGIQRSSCWEKLDSRMLLRLLW